MTDQRRTLSRFGAWLTAQLRQRGWSQAEFARRCGVGPDVVVAWRYGAQPRQRSRERIAAALGVPLAEVEAVLPLNQLRCPACGETDPAKFRRHRRRATGYQTYCKRCHDRRYGRGTGRPRRVRIGPGFLRCARCQRDLDISAFRLQRRRTGEQRSSYCRECERILRKQWTLRRLADPEIAARERQREREKVQRRLAKERWKRGQERAWRAETAKRAIRALREAGLRMADIAALAGTSLSVVSACWHGRSVPRETTVLKLTRTVAAVRRDRAHVLPEASTAHAWEAS